MEPFIFGSRNGIHIINLDETVPMLQRALESIHEVSRNGGKVLFVGTKRQTQEVVKEIAEKTGHYYVNHRWLGGMMTNWKTVVKSIKRLKELEKEFEVGVTGYTKRELLNRERELGKLKDTLGGIKDMGRTPDIIIVLDTIKDELAVQEANKLKIPVVGIVDTNSDPDLIDLPIPGNDDAIRSISLYCDLFGATILEGMKDLASKSNIDLGESIEVAEEVVVEETVSEEVAVEEVASGEAAAK